MNPTHQRAIHILPDTSGVPGIEAFRKDFDRLFQYIAAHVTLVFPFDLPLTDEQLISHCESCAHGIQPFTVTLLPPCISDDAYFWLPVEPTPPLAALTGKLHEGPLSPLAATGSPHRHHHITLARPPLPHGIHEAFAQHRIPFPITLRVTSFMLEAIQPDNSSKTLGIFQISS